MNCAYLSDEPHGPAFLQRYLVPWGVKLQPHRLGSPVEEPVLFLFQPFWCKDRLVSCAANWKRYLEKKQGEVKLITVSLEVTDHPNGICLLELPADWPRFLETALPCGANWKPASEQTDLDNLLFTFYEGHGHDSVRSLLTPLKNTLQTIDRELKQGEAFLDILAQAHNAANLPEIWRLFRIRWQHYYDYWHYLPFFPLFEAANRLIGHIDPYFVEKPPSETSFRALRCFENMNQIKQIIDDCHAYCEQ